MAAPARLTLFGTRLSPFVEKVFRALVLKELPVELLRWITDSGGRVRSMEIRSVTLHEALKQRAQSQEAKP